MNINCMNTGEYLAALGGELRPNTVEFRCAHNSRSQGFAVKVLADPTKRVALLQQMPVEVYEELAYFAHAMPEAEQMAVEKALGL